MATLLISGVMGATLAAALSNYGIVEDVQLPVANLGLATKTVLGFVAGVVIWYALSFLRIRVIRLLLSCDHWFIARQNFIDYVSDLFLAIMTSATSFHLSNTAVGDVFEIVTG